MINPMYGNLIVKADTLNKQTSISDFPGGGKIYSFNIDGYTVTSAVPPDNFNPVTATDEQLQKYGFEPRPKDSSKLNAWQERMSHYKSTPIPAIGVTDFRENINQSLQDNAQNTIYNSDYSCPSWSGYENDVGGFNATEGDFVIPSISSTYSEAEESSWVGIGGDQLHFGGNGGLIQAGVYWERSTGKYTPFYEWINAAGQGVQGLSFSGISVKAGDLVDIYVDWSNPLNYTAYFGIEDLTNGQSANYTATLNSNFYDTKTADWIDEAPCINDGSEQAPLGNYGTINWSVCYSELTTDNMTAFNSRHCDRDIATNGTTILSEPDLPSSTSSFTDHFYNASY
jgi:hypothetical protein